MITPGATIIHYAHASEPDEVEQQIKVLAGRVSLMQRHQPMLAVRVGCKLYEAMVLLRIALFGAAALMTGQVKTRASAQAWRQIWRARPRWINGWTDAAVNAARNVPGVKQAVQARVK
jgi:hypothetical protein